MEMLNRLIGMEEIEAEREREREIGALGFGEEHSNFDILIYRVAWREYF